MERAFRNLCPPCPKTKFIGLPGTAKAQDKMCRAVRDESSAESGELPGLTDECAAHRMNRHGNFGIVGSQD